MTAREHMKKAFAECDHGGYTICRPCVTAAIVFAQAEMREKILSIVAGGDRPWQELAKIIRALEIT